MYKEILRITRHMVQRDPEDIAHDVWIWFFLHPKKCPPKRWLIRCRILDRLRTRKHMRHLTQDVEQPIQHPLEGDIDKMISSAHLTDTEQMIIYYRHVLNLSFSQISRELNIPRATLGPITRNILERLRSTV